MEQIKRDLYLNLLIERRENGIIEVVTGIRWCGKLYLLFKLYYQYFIESGVESSRIISVPLDNGFVELHDRKNWLSTSRNTLQMISLNDILDTLLLFYKE